MHDSVSGVKGMSPCRPPKNARLCCRTCLSSRQMCNLGVTPLPPHVTASWRQTRGVSFESDAPLVEDGFHSGLCASSACARPLRVRVLCLYLATESGCRSVTQQFLKGKKNQKQINLQFVVGGGSDQSVSRVRTSSCSPGSVIHPIKSFIPRFLRPKRELLLQRWHSEARASQH